MIIEQMYTACLAHAAYYIESNGEAAVIDPLRDIDVYLEKAENNAARIKYIFETHFHADFVSGHIDLAHKSGATIVFGPNAEAQYKVHVGYDNEVFKVGNITIKVLHTPGHTIESACYLLTNEKGKDYCLFTGDTFFVGDVGRPDLLSGNLSKEELASYLYDSLNNKIKPLADDIIVYPGHGPGSACGKNIGIETVSTMGEQKKYNYALQNIDRDTFIKTLTADLPTPPPYFFKDAGINKNGYSPFDDIITRNNVALNIEEFKQEMQEGAIVLDTRSADDFATGYIKGAINIGLNGDFAVWVGTLIDFDAPLLLVTNKGQEKEAVTRLARIGYENVRGYLNGGIQTWIVNLEELDSIPNLSSDTYYPLINTEEYILLDVRRESEAATLRVYNSVNIPLAALKKNLNNLNTHNKYLVYCAGGYRSMIASSLLKANGFKDVLNINGGITNIKQTVPELIEQ